MWWRVALCGRLWKIRGQVRSVVWCRPGRARRRLVPQDLGDPALRKFVLVHQALGVDAEQYSRRIRDLARRVGAAAERSSVSSSSATSNPEFEISSASISLVTDVSGTRSIRSISLASVGSPIFSGCQPGEHHMLGIHHADHRLERDQVPDARLVAHEVDHLHSVLCRARMRPGVARIPISEHKGIGRRWGYETPS
jgi:hypothetical protein